jgi:hypothetical protein
MGKRLNKFKGADNAAAGGEKASDGTDLKSEVADFAASLGLVIGAGSSDAAFNDFAPAKASRRLGSPGDEVRRNGYI